MNPRPLEKIDALTDEQRQQLADWLLTETLDKARELAEQEFGANIPRSTLHRFRKRCEMSDYLDTSGESARARAELIHAAASGRPNFCQATIALLEKQVFELAHGLHDEGALDALKNLFGLINHHKNTVVRERMAAVQERQAQLREEELALKKTANSDLAPRPSDSLSDDLGPLATTLDEIEARATKKFCLPPIAPPPTPTQNRLSQAHDSSSANAESHESVSLPESLSKTSSQPTNESQDLPDRNTFTTTEARESSSLACFPYVPSVPSPAPQCQIENAQPRSGSSHLQFQLSTMLNESGHPSTNPPIHSSSLESRVSACTLAEKSAFRAPTASSPQSAIVSHALRRWIAYTPFRPGMPPRDESWNEECPCGAKLPCDHHDHLWREVRYMKPWDPDYSAALARHNIPFHRPTEDELQAAAAAPSSETLSETLSSSGLNSDLHVSTNPSSSTALAFPIH